MRNSLEKIRIWLEREAPHLATSLQPGLSPEDMQRIMGPKDEQYRIPIEVAELYAWRNGQAGSLPFFEVVRFQPFEEAVAYGNLAGEYFDGEFPLMIFQELDYDAGYQIRCGPEEQTISPAIAWEHGDESIQTPSLTSLLSAVAEAFEAGAFRPNDLGGLDTDDILWNSILVRHHPDRLHGMDALLSRQWVELNGEHLLQAFSDAWATNPIEAAALVREYLGDHRDRLIQDFDTFYSVVHIGLDLLDEWTRDFALSLIFSDVPRIRGAALSNLAWRWHGEMPLTEQQVDGLIDQIMTGRLPVSHDRECAMLLGVSEDRRAVPALVWLINGPSRHRDSRIAALTALGRLQAVETRQLCLTVAQTDTDPGTRITAVRALEELGFEDAAVEAAAKAYFREMLQRFGNRMQSVIEQNQTPTFKRWLEETMQSISNEGGSA